MASDIDIETLEVERLVKREAMVNVVDALQNLSREDQIEVLKCVRQFYGLPIVD